MWAGFDRADPIVGLGISIAIFAVLIVADLAVTIDGNLAVRDGHLIAEEVRHRLLHGVRHLDDANVHVDPTGPDPHELTSHHRGP